MIHIQTAQDLQNMKNDLTESYILDNDIDMTGFDWVPIGQDSNKFSGVFNGNHHIISNLTTNYTADNYCGLFGASTGQIYDVGLQNIDITGKTDVGGVVGFNYGTIERCWVTGNIRATSSNADAGGIVSVNSTNSAKIKDCWTDVTVTSVVGAGGIAGHNSFAYLINCYSLGSSFGTDAGGVAGRVSVYPQLYYTSSYWNTDTSINNDSAGEGSGVYPKNTTEMKQQSTYVGWDFNDVWYIQEGKGYPKLRVGYDIESINLSESRSNKLASIESRSNKINSTESRGNKIYSAESRGNKLTSEISRSNNISIEVSK